MSKPIEMLLPLALLMPLTACVDDANGADDAADTDADTNADTAQTGETSAGTTGAPTTGSDPSGDETSADETSTGEPEDSTGEPPELSNIDKAVALIEAFESGDPTALDYVAETYIQHNLEFPDGKGVLAGFLTGRPTGIETTVHRVFEDGDIVFMHNEFGGTWNEGVPQVTFDVFRFDADGLITEHWDNLADIVDDGDGTTQLDGPTEATALGDTEANRALVEDAAQTLFIAGQWSQLGDYFDLESYIQHSVGFGPDATALEEFLGALPDGTPFYTSVEYVYAMGDMALVMSEGFPDERTGLSDAYYDLFRVENGLIVEHWDIIQTIPAMEDWANDNGKW
ncbi:MAG: nuclear transport factor 2 family protein [Myxococcota bacterium]